MGSIIILQEVLEITTEIAMIYFEMRLFHALREGLQLFQNKSFGKGARGLFAAISDLSGQQEWNNNK